MPDDATAHPTDDFDALLRAWLVGAPDEQDRAMVLISAWLEAELHAPTASVVAQLGTRGQH